MVSVVAGLALIILAHLALRVVAPSIANQELTRVLIIGLGLVLSSMIREWFSTRSRSSVKLHDCEST